MCNIAASHLLDLGRLPVDQGQHYSSRLGNVGRSRGMTGVGMGTQDGRASPGPSDAPLAAALAGSGAAVALLRGDDLVLEYANQAHQDLFCWPAGSPLRRVAPAAGPVRAVARRVLRTGAPDRADEVPASDDRIASVICSPAGDGRPEPGVLMVAVDTTAQVAAHRAAEDRNERLTVLDQATAAVTAHMDPRRELIALAESVVPSLADACAVYLIDQAPRGRRRSDHAVRATRLTCVIDPALGVPPPPPEIRLPVAATRPTSRAVVSRQAVLARDAARHTQVWGERWLHALAPHSLVAVPLGSPEVAAVVKFVGTGDRPPYRASDVALMREITARADTAFGHAMQLQHANEVAFALQRGLLSDPAELDWLEIAVRYRPAVPGLEVGGDWYDTLILPDGGLGLAVGDVVGHDLYAVSTMIQLRSMVQALACQPDAEPGPVLTALNRLCAHLGMGNLATLVYGRLERAEDPAKVTLTWANAGHPPPLLVPPTGTASVLDHTTSPLLSLTDHNYQQATLPVPAEGLLLFYTDGLIENPEQPSDDPITELAEAATRHNDHSLDDLCDQLIATAPNADDVALLAVRVHA
jgi:serine phosphatase RsbU (regulator of sigma subunit)